MWWEASRIEELGFITIQDQLEIWRTQHVTFLDQFGAAARAVPIDKVRAAMEALAARYGTITPDVSEFFNYLAASAGTLSSSDYKAVAVEAVEAAGSLATGFLGAYALIAGIGLLLFFWSAGSKTGAGIGAAAKKATA